MRIKALTIFLTLTLVLALTIPLSQGNSSVVGTILVHLVVVVTVGQVHQSLRLRISH